LRVGERAQEAVPGRERQRDPSVEARQRGPERRRVRRVGRKIDEDVHAQPAFRRAKHGSGGRGLLAECGRQRLGDRGVDGQPPAPRGPMPALWRRGGPPPPPVGPPVSPFSALGPPPAPPPPVTLTPATIEIDRPT